jgi:dTDP-4-dehydrorhamnose reductase
MSLGRVLITGGGGQLASELEALLSDSSDVVALSREQLDVTDQPAVERTFASVRPEIVFNCAAFHNVEVCEREEDRSFEVNARAVKRLAQRCAGDGAVLVHFSTNYVFDGRRDEPYAEYDLPNPRSVYAISKLAGEYAALAYAQDALVVRTAGLYGLAGSASKGGNFVTRMIARAQEGGRLKVVADQRLSPTYTADLARSVIDAVSRGTSGLLHLSSTGDCSWHEFTVAIMESAGIEVTVEPARTEPSPDRADRPLNGVLRRPVAHAAGLPALPHWRDGLERYLERATVASTNPR